MSTHKKRIIVFADGTWNTPANIDSDAVSPTNVFNLFKCTQEGMVEQGVEQVVYYSEGVGTGLGNDKVLGGMLGKGINENIIEAYRFVVDHYNAGDELFFFGFSRGAYTVRSLAGLIKNCGILKKNYYQKINRAFVIYRSPKKKHQPDSEESIQFRKFFSHPMQTTTIKFIGVWDTVGSLGVPFKFFNINSRKFRFHNVQLSDLVEHAYHAISVDERRVFFRPALWRKPENTLLPAQTLEQVWFNGVHSDVGGGYHNGSLQLLPLDYMRKKAKACGLVFSDHETHCVCDLQRFSLDEPHPSKEGTWFYRIFPDYYRIIDNNNRHKLSLYRRIGLFFLKLIMQNSDDSTQGNTFEFLHESVVYKYSRHPEKLPPNLYYTFNKLVQAGRIKKYEAGACDEKHEKAA